MAKEIKMNAEPGKLGSRNKPLKSFKMEFNLTQKGEIVINQSNEGFNDYEVVAFLTLMQQKIVNLINQNQLK